jgi:hypothetical protein
VILSDLRTGQQTLLSLDTPGTRAALVVPRSARTNPAVARAEGSLAPYVSAGQVTTTTQGSARGLAAVTCAAPQSEWWFVGGGGAVGRRTTVWLSNPDTTQAVVDIDVYGPDGPVPGHGTTGIVVPAQRQTGVRLDVVVPGTSRAAMHVVARAGRVSAAVQDVDTKGLVPRGADFVPAGAAPALQVVVPGVPGGGSGTRLLQVAAPGDADAIVNVKVVAADGTFTPEDAGLLEITAGSVAQVDLAPALTDTGTTSVLLQSDVPVVASVRTVLPRSAGSAEITWAVGVPALAGPASFGPLLVGSRDTPALTLAAVGDAGAVTVSVLNPDETEPRTREVAVPAGTSVTTVLAEALNGAAVVVTPADGSGPVQAALAMTRTDSGGTLRTTVPLVSAPRTISVPAVRPDPATGVPGH